MTPTSLSPRASFRRLLISSSARVGSKAPDGWLCARITLGAPQSGANFTDYPRVSACGTNRAPEELDELNEPEPCVHEDDATVHLF